MLDIGCHFSTSADSLITECHVRTRLALATYEAAVLAEAKPDEINTKLNSFLELFIREKDIVRHTETFKATEHGHELEVYQTRISTNFLVQRNQSGLMTRFLIDGGTNAVLVLKFIQNNKDKLPDELVQLAEVQVILDNVLEHHQKSISTGHQPTLSDASLLVEEIATAQRLSPRLCERRAGVAAAIQGVHAQFSAAKNVMGQKIDSIDSTLGAFEKSFEGISPCISTWEFKGCPWIHKQEHTPERAAVVKALEQVSFQFNSWKNTFEKCTRMACNSGDDKIYFAAKVQLIEATEARLKTASVTLACAMLASTLLQSDSQVATKEIGAIYRYAKVKLGVEQSEFPQMLKNKANDLTTEWSKSKAGPGLQGEDAAGDSKATQAVVKKPLLKKLTKT
jgi:hypothetical protein